jgi:ribosomal protein L16/L10AE
MGKGKGNFTRWSIKMKAGTKLFETKNFSTYRMNYFLKIVQKITKIKASLITKKTKNLLLASKKNFFWVF